jgi:hypothetical protein
MSITILIVILFWSVFWLGYALYTLNSGRMYYRPNKVFTQRQRPVLFTTEILISFMWSGLGFAMLYIYLKQGL